MPTFTLLEATRWQDYELIDSGDGLKLERFGKYTFARPESQAMWSIDATGGAESHPSPVDLG